MPNPNPNPTSYVNPTPAGDRTTLPVSSHIQDRYRLTTGSRCGTLGGVSG